jgi:uncharacterized hydrophobic protein (TIGR00271 family)
MLQTLLNNFRLGGEKESFETVEENLFKAVVFKGTNLWILIFATFIASFGLNVNSTAVIIGAMLISPLMGPIMGMGFGLAVYDISLARLAARNFLFATAASLVTSTLYFTITPISDAHSEILARTAPNVYDVLIAFFGGLAGMLATCSKAKGNVIPGVAIATALMPPLCTAGYGFATLQLKYMFGALYLFVINTVFIALASLLVVRLLRYPMAYPIDRGKIITRSAFMTLLAIVTTAPSVWFAYEQIRDQGFATKANRFIDAEAHFPDEVLLVKKIDAAANRIELVFGGRSLQPAEIAAFKTKALSYGIDSSRLEVKQGFAYLAEAARNDEVVAMRTTIQALSAELASLRHLIDSLRPASGDSTVSAAPYSSE